MAMNFYWLVVSGPKINPTAEDKRPCTVYALYGTKPFGTTEVATELEGLDVNEAMNFLDGVYESVRFNESELYPRIVCHGSLEDYEASADYEDGLTGEALEGLVFEGEEDDGMVFED